MGKLSQCLTLAFEFSRVVAWLGLVCAGMFLGPFGMAQGAWKGFSNRSGPAIVAAPTTFPSVPSIADVSSVNREAN